VRVDDVPGGGVPQRDLVRVVVPLTLAVEVPAGGKYRKKKQESIREQEIEAHKRKRKKMDKCQKQEKSAQRRRLPPALHPVPLFPFLS
jgi:hypothetical protein